MTRNAQELFFCGFLLLLCLVNAAVIKKQQEADKTPWDMNEALRNAVTLVGFNGTWMTDNEFYYVAKDRSVRTYNAATKQDELFVEASVLNSYVGASFTLSPDNGKMLITHNVTEVKPYNYVAQFDIYNIRDRTSVSIHNGEKLQYCGWCPLSLRLACVYKNNVFIHVVDSQEEHFITENGIEYTLYNGIPDLVYGFIGMTNALWWSPNGLKLAVGFFNDSHVENFTYALYGDAGNPSFQYPQEISIKYPKAGTANPTVHLSVFDLSNEKNLALDIAAPVDIVGSDHIMLNVVWPSNEHVLVFWANRRQNVASLQRCSMQGACKEVTRIEEPNGWVAINAPTCLSNGKSCLLNYFIDNWFQVWKLDLETGTNSWKSRGNFTIITVYGYDEINDKLYYQAAHPMDTSVYHVYSNDDCLSCSLMDMNGVACRTAKASFSKSYAYYSLTCSGPTPMYTNIFDAHTNTNLIDWESNAGYVANIVTKLLPSYVFMNVTLADGSIGMARLALPPNFNETLKYPLIVSVYNGPNSALVTSTFTVSYETVVTTAHQVIYAVIDGRGTANRGKDFLFSVNNDLGHSEVDDQLFVTKWLQNNLPYVDRERTAIWGHSFGGFMAAKTIQQDDDHIFACAAALAPVTSWFYFDSFTAERFLGLPETNMTKYEESSLFGRLDNFRTHKFLLIHGTADENVHLQQSLLFAKQLQRADIQFEQQIYTDETHGFGLLTAHVYNTLDNFFVNCLNL